MYMENKPFLLRPSGKDYLWGGTRLNDEFAKNIDMTPLAETWECSTHPDGPSYVASGVFKGMTLTEVLKAHPYFLGSHTLGSHTLGSYTLDNDTSISHGLDSIRPDKPRSDNPSLDIPSRNCQNDDFCPWNGQLPILIKLIDAKRDLSIQVHPTDQYAKDHENGQLGKTEMWYVLDAVKDAKLVYGLKHDCDAQTLRQAISDGTVEKYLQKVPVKKDDLFLIEAGTIHAVGAGTLLAEIQENSNLTYRLYDYDRIDKNGQKRGLHIDKALAVANLSSSTEPKQPLRVLKYCQGTASELLCRCKYFEVYRMIVNTERRQVVHYQSDDINFRILLCVGGCGTISYENDRCDLKFYKGDCLFVPANSIKFRIHGQAKFLDVRG